MPTTADPAQGPRPSAGPRASILLIEDEEQLAATVGEALTFVGYRVSRARSGREGLDLFRRGGVDVAVVDASLPDVSGLAVARELRREVPVILMSAYSYPAVPVDLQPAKAGFDTFLQKPFGVAELQAAIDALLGVGG